ncbi:MAG TPA: COX15/CtaA family protein [Chitinophagaceae bacterium]
MANPMNEERSQKIIANWVFIGVGMLIVQVLLGGITRLTGSGLSITEWKPIMGALPPMNEAAWQTAFEKYRQIAQYKYINNHFTLSDFKFIYFWEWFHRNWGRLIGIAFAIPFIYFLVKGYFRKWMVMPLVILFLLGGLQGAIGWIMVQSGLNDQDVYVSHIRLAVHFIAAMVLICYALVFGMKLTVRKRDLITSSSLWNFTLPVFVLLMLQLIYGAFMAGLRAATVAPTWPDMNGTFVPDIAGESWVNSHLAVHFIHRTIAYILLLMLIGWWILARRYRESRLFNRLRNWVLVLVIVQVTLGVLAVLNSLNIVRGKFGVFESLALLHQVTGMVLLLVLTAAFYLTRWSY